MPRVENNRQNRQRSAYDDTGTPSVLQSAAYAQRPMCLAQGTSLAAALLVAAKARASPGPAPAASAPRSGPSRTVTSRRLRPAPVGAASRTAGAGPSSTRILGGFQGPSQTPMRHSACHNYQRGLTVPRPTVAPTATCSSRSRVYFNTPLSGAAAGGRAAAGALRRRHRGVLETARIWRGAGTSGRRATANPSASRSPAVRSRPASARQATVRPRARSRTGARMRNTGGP